MLAVTTDQWIVLYQSETKADRIRAGKQIGAMTREQIQDLKKTLEHRHIAIRGKLALVLENPDTMPSNGNGSASIRKVFWGDNEWDFVVEKVAALHLKEPTTGITNLATRIMGQMPSEQRRPAHAGLVSELAKRLTDYNKRWLDLDQDLRTAKEEIARRKEALSREEVIASLTDEEVQQFAQRVLDSLAPIDLCSRFSESTILDCISTEALIASTLTRICSQAGQHLKLLAENLTMQTRLLAELPQEKIHRQLMEKPAPARLPQIAFVGFKAEQIAIVADALRGRIRIDIIDKNRSTFDSQADIVIIWTKFISHSFQDSVRKNIKKGARLIQFSGGLESAAKEIERVLAL